MALCSKGRALQIVSCGTEDGHIWLHGKLQNAFFLGFQVPSCNHAAREDIAAHGIISSTHVHGWTNEQGLEY